MPEEDRLRECPKCADYGTTPYCTKCGEKMVDLPQCGFCKKDFIPTDNFCGWCGRRREEAIKGPQSELPFSCEPLDEDASDI